MSNSSLIAYTKLSPNNSGKRKYPITKITIHHMAGNLSIEQCGEVFQSRQASANYGIGSDGRVALYVDEANRSWASSNADNDNRAVTIEVANDGGESSGWHVSQRALEARVGLCVDICKRNGIKELVYNGTKHGTLTMHCMFAATACPGPYLKSRFPWIADQVNKILRGDTSAGSVPVSFVPAKTEEEGGLDMATIRTLTTAQQDTYDELVKTVQILLNAKIGTKLAKDGFYGPKTAAAVKTYQSKNGLAVDGMAGPKTLSKLFGV